jgi:tRNA(Phe) wybutosine-synthesizing methylase Tyw3
MASREEVERFISAIRADEALRGEVERAILHARLLQLPDQVGELTEAVRRLVAVTTEHTERLDRIDEALERLVAVTTEHGEQLARLVAVTTEHTERLDRIDEALERLVAVSTEHGEQLARLVAVTTEHTERLDRIDEALERLVAVTTEHERRLGRLEDELGDLKGDFLEDRVRTRHDDVLCDHVVGGTVLSHAQIMDLTRKPGHGLELLSVDEAKTLRQADMVLVGGRSPESNKRLSAVVEVSSRAGHHDVERARNRANILVHHGHTCLAIVVTRYPIEDQWKRLADAASVIVLTVGAAADAA